MRFWSSFYECIFYSELTLNQKQRNIQLWVKKEKITFLKNKEILILQLIAFYRQQRLRREYVCHFMPEYCNPRTCAPRQKACQLIGRKRGLYRKIEDRRNFASWRFYYFRLRVSLKEIIWLLRKHQKLVKNRFFKEYQMQPCAIFYLFYRLRYVLSCCITSEETY